METQFDGNVMVDHLVGSEPTYEGWKPGSSDGSMALSSIVPSLPMRDGNTYTFAMLFV